jgi:hypothetical protein
MVTLTRSEAKAVFDHILNKVLGINDSSNLKRGLFAEEIADIFHLSSLDDGFIDDREYPDPKDPDCRTTWFFVLVYELRKRNTVPVLSLPERLSVLGLQRHLVPGTYWYLELRGEKVVIPGASRKTDLV